MTVQRTVRPSFGETLGAAIHDVTTNISHKMAVLAGEEDECMVFGRVIAARMTVRDATCRDCGDKIRKSDNGFWFHTKKARSHHMADPGCPSGECGHYNAVHVFNFGCVEDECMCTTEPI